MKAAQAPRTIQNLPSGQHSRQQQKHPHSRRKQEPRGPEALPVQKIIPAAQVRQDRAYDGNLSSGHDSAVIGS